MTTVIAVACVGLGSFALRFLPMLLAERGAWPAGVDRALRLASTSALAYVTMAGAASVASGGWSAAVGAVIGIGVGLVLTVRGHRLITVVAVGLAVAWLAGAASALVA